MAVFCSAELYSAVSQSCTLRNAGIFHARRTCERPADYKSAIQAIQQIENLRYVCDRPSLLQGQSNKMRPQERATQLEAVILASSSAASLLPWAADLPSRSLALARSFSTPSPVS